MQIRPLQTPAERQAAYALQVGVWGVEQSVPTNQMVVAAQIGGLVLGAFAPDGALAGFSFALPAVAPAGGPACLWSDILAVDPAWRGQGLGKELKWAQRSHALAMGYRLIRWTYDPVQAVNAWLNISTLGATASTYLESLYGPMADELNRGMPTDRLVVDWVLDRQPPTRPQPPADRIPSVLVIEPGEVPRVHDVRPDLATPVLLCPIPESFVAVRHADREAALQWRLAVRAALTAYFARGYAITGMATAGPRLPAYVLTTKE